jgi:hypothetical protein
MLLAESLLGSSSVEANYIEDVFSTYLYTGTGASQTITNGIDLAGKGGLVWIKRRNDTTNHWLMDTERLPLNSFFTYRRIVSNGTNANLNYQQGISSFNSSGFVLDKAPDGGDPAANDLNSSGQPFVSWTFREQPKFFDVVTYTGNGANRTIAHNLGSVPGCIMIKRTDTTAAWAVYHRSLANTQYMVLNTTAAAATGATYWNSTTPTSSVFSLGTSTDVNASGGTYVAYLFAHDAGGFGATDSDNVISCGSYTGNGSTNGPTVNLGYEPQWLLIKRTSGGTGGWWMFDNLRGLSLSNDILLQANTSGAESTLVSEGVNPNATGFSIYGATADLNASGSTYIYVSIRRGPMKSPTIGTAVFSPFTGLDNATYTPSFPVDMAWDASRSGNIDNTLIVSRLSGYQSALVTSNTSAEKTNYLSLSFFQSNTTFNFGGIFGVSSAMYAFRRAPGFFDVVCYTGTGTNLTVNHNLGVVPELMILKGRSSLRVWAVYSASILNTEYLRLDSSLAKATGADYWNSTTPTSSVFSVGTNVAVNTASATQIAYLFATVAGVSKVGSYTGTGTTNQINCGFTGGARFVMIKRTDSTGDWYVWDSARGIVAGNDSYLLLNSTAAEVTNTDYVDTYSAGFEISSTAPAAINANGGSFIFLAIA